MPLPRKGEDESEDEKEKDEDEESEKEVEKEKEDKKKNDKRKKGEGSPIFISFLFTVQEIVDVLSLCQTCWGGGRGSSLKWCSLHIHFLCVVLDIGHNVCPTV